MNTRTAVLRYEIPVDDRWHTVTLTGPDCVRRFPATRGG